MSKQEKVVWDKLIEASKAAILSNSKIPHNPSTYVNFHDVTLGKIIMDSSHKFDFGETPNGPSNNDLIEKDHDTDNDGDTPIILSNLYKRYMVSPEYTRRYYLTPIHILHKG